MKYPMYAFRDLKAGGFAPPMCQINEAVARRDFDYRLHNDHSMGFAPSDFELFYIGEFDSDTGSVDPCLPVFICSGADFV